MRVEVLPCFPEDHQTSSEGLPKFTKCHTKFSKDFLKGSYLINLRRHEGHLRYFTDFSGLTEDLPPGIPRIHSEDLWTRQYIFRTFGVSCDLYRILHYPQLLGQIKL